MANLTKLLGIPYLVGKIKSTLPETNIAVAPENKPGPKGKSSSNHQFSGAMLVLGRVINVLTIFFSGSFPLLKSCLVAKIN